MKNAYIHYGSNKYDPDKFKPIKNNPMLAIPEGGLWASPKNAVFGWKEWYKCSDFQRCNIDIFFEFTLSQNARILQINCKDDLLDLPEADLPKEIPNHIIPWVCLDFEKLVISGVDAIQVNMSNDLAIGFGDGLYNALYGWDCDSILVMNKEVIICEEETIK